MDGRLNKIATALIAVFAITFLLFLAQILFFLIRRRRHSHLPAAAQPKQKYFYPLFWRNNSRIQPREIVSNAHYDSEVVVVAVETAEAGDELDKWRQLIGPSRDLFTINEEEEDGDREGIESCECDSKLDCDTTSFYTPCGSPPFFTPSPSPTRHAGDIPVEKDSSSDDDGDRTAPFSSIEITDY